MKNERKEGMRLGRIKGMVNRRKYEREKRRMKGRK